MPPRQLMKTAELGLPYRRSQIIRRAMMHLPWRMFVRRQVEFNRASALATRDLTRAVRRLDRRLARLEDLVEGIAAHHRDGAAIAVREQLYDTEGALQSQIGALQIELARLAGDIQKP